MIDDRIRALVNADLDGELSPADSDELKQVLEASAESRAYQEEILKMHHLLTALPAVEPPPALHDQIMSAIPMANRAPRETAASKSRWWLPEVPGFFRYGMATMAGLVIAVGIYEVVPEVTAPVDPREVVGTMAQDPGPDFLAIDSAALNLSGVAGSAVLQQDGDVLLLRLTLDSDRPVTVNMNVAGGGLTFGALSPAETSPIRIVDLEFSDSAIGGSLSGEQTLLVRLDAGADAGLSEALITVSLKDEQNEIWEAELSPGRKLQQQ